MNLSPTPSPNATLTRRWCPPVQLVWIETPTNPTMKVVDIKTCSDICHEHDKNIVVVVDNTFMSAYFQVRIVLVCASRSWPGTRLLFLNTFFFFFLFSNSAPSGFRSGCMHVFCHQIHERYVVHVFFIPFHMVTFHQSLTGGGGTYKTVSFEFNLQKYDFITNIKMLICNFCYGETLIRLQTWMRSNQLSDVPCFIFVIRSHIKITTFKFLFLPQDFFFLFL